MSIINVAIVGTTVLTSLVESGDTVNVSIGSAVAGTSPLVTAGTIQVGNVTTLAFGANATVTNKGSGIAAVLDFGIPSGRPASLSIGTVESGTAASATITGTSSSQVLSLVLPQAPAGSLSIGNVTGGTAASATITGAAPSQVLSLVLPRGADGQAASLSIGNVTGGTAASATITGAAPSQVLSLVLPQGAAGPAASLSIGTVTNGTAASATITGAGPSQVLSLVLPQGAAGGGASIGDIAPANLAATAAAGTSSLAARADHVHALPVIAYGNLTGVPTNFATNTTLVSGLAESYAAAGHAHPYVTALNNLNGALTLVAGGNVTITPSGSNLTIAASGGGLGENDAVDGGSYVGQIVGGITFTIQPQSQTVTLGSAITWTSAANAASGLTLQTAGSVMYAAKVSSSNLSIAKVSNAAALNSASYVNAPGTRDGTLNSSQQNASYSLTLAQVGNLIIALSGSQWTYQAGGATAYTETTTLVASSSDNGSSWGNSQPLLQAMQAPSAGVPYSICANDFGFVATVRPSETAFDYTYYGLSASSSILQSSTGSAWNARSLPQSRPWQVAGGGSVFVAVSQRDYTPTVYGGAANAIYSTDNGITWSKANTAFTTESAPVYGNGRFVAVMESTAYMTLNGTSWASASLPAGASDYRRISFANGRFFALRDASTTDVAISTDGTNWTLGSLPSSQTWTSVGAAGGYYAAASNGTTWAYGSPPANGTANFTVAATADSGAAVSYQWQSSADAGATWADLAGNTTSSLSLSVSAADSGRRYRAVASAVGAANVSSQSATLTVQ